MAIDFDCYLIDEIVAVGDDRFQRKCQVELFEKRADKAMLIVSHSPEFIRDHCHKASVLVAGELTNFDDVEDAYAFYSSHELAMQPHMQENPPPPVVHLPPNPAALIADGYAQASSTQEYRAFLGPLRIDDAPVFDSCDLIGQLDRAGDENAALELAVWLSERRPNEPLFWITLGDLYAKRRQHLPCIHAYREALRLNPASYWGNRNLATELFTVGRYAEAIPHFDAAVAVAPSPASAIELKLRRLDCNVLLDRVTLANRADFGVPLKTSTLIDQSAAVLRDGRSARLSIGGLAGSETDVSNLTCVFVSDEASLPAQPTFARNSIRRLARCSDSNDFAFVYYGPINEAVGAVDFVLSDNGKVLLTGSIPVRRSSDWGGDEELSFHEAARLANKEHRAEASVFLYGAGAQRGEPFDVVQFGESLVAVGEYDEAEYLLLDWLQKHDRDHIDRAFVFDLLCQELARSRIPGWRDVIDSLLKAEAVGGDSVSLMGNFGHARVADNNIPDAIRYYQQASRLAPGQDLIHFARGIHTAKLADEVPRLVPENLPPKGKEPGPDIVHLFACDANYFRRFAPALVASSARKKGDVRLLIHAHIIDPSPESLELAVKLKAEFDIAVTTEESPSAINDHSVKRAYFTCARFLVAPELLRDYHCPILITEADCLLNWSWSDLQEFIAGADVGHVYSSMWNWVPWTKIPAGIVLLSPSNEGIEHADYIARYIRHAFEREGSGAIDLWTVDQVALWLANVTWEKGRSVHLPMFSILTLATGDKSNLAL
jgi:tetratricopeptide (TPR) repeat protein